MADSENKRTIDLTQVQIEQVDKRVVTQDVSKLIASALYNIAQTLPVSVACQELYKTGICEYTEEIKNAIIHCLDRTEASYALRTGVMKVIG